MPGPLSYIEIGSSEMPGRTFNMLVRDWYERHGSLGRGIPGLTGPGEYIVVKATNETGQDLGYGSAVAIEKLKVPVSSKSKFHRPTFKAQFNSSDLDHSTVGVANRLIKAGKPGTFIVAGSVWVQVNFTDITHKFAKLPDAQADPKIVSAASGGYPILDSEEVSAPGVFWAAILVGSGTSGGTGTVTIDIVYIDKDIDAVIEADPEEFLETGDIELTDAEREAEYEIAFQDPSDPDLDANHVDHLALHGYTRRTTKLKEFEPDIIKGTAQADGALGADQIKLDTTASSTNGYYEDDLITFMAVAGTAQSYTGDANKFKLGTDESAFIHTYEGWTVKITGGTGAGQKKKITSFDPGTDRVATVDSDWDTPPDNTSTYLLYFPAPIARTVDTYVGSSKISTVDSDWDAAPDGTQVGGGKAYYEINSIKHLKLATTITDDPDSDPPRKIVRYKTIEVYYDDSQDFICGEYTRGEFQNDPNYDEDGVWPPPWVESPDTFFRKKYRGIVINKVLLKINCQPIKPPVLPAPS